MVAAVKVAAGRRYGALVLGSTAGKRLEATIWSQSMPLQTGVL